MKNKYLVFTNNELPRLLVNPTEHTLAQFPSDQVVKATRLTHIKGVPLEHLVLENGVVRKASKDEVINLSNKVQTNAAMRESIMDKSKLVDNIQRKMNELNDSVLLLMGESKEELEKAEKKARKCKILVIIMGIICVAELAYIIENTGLLK